MPSFVHGGKRHVGGGTGTRWMPFKKLSNTSATSDANMGMHLNLFLSHTSLGGSFFMQNILNPCRLKAESFFHMPRILHCLATEPPKSSSL